MDEVENEIMDRLYGPNSKSNSTNICSSSGKRLLSMFVCSPETLGIVQFAGK